MGGVVNAIEKGVKTVVHAIEKTVDVVVDVVDLAIKTVTLPTEIIYDTVIKGESFKKTIANGIQDLAKDMQDVYGSLVDDVLGIDDNSFLGLKGSFFSKLGMLTKDFMNDHATSTIGIGVIVGVLAISIFFPPAYSFAGAATLAAFEAGITSSIALMGVYYITLTAVSFGISSLLSGIIDGAVLGMYGTGLLEKISFFEEKNEMLRIGSLAAILDGSIYDRLAGGWMYDSQFAGGVYYDASNAANLGLSVGEEFNVSPQSILENFGFVDATLKDLAGSSNFSVLKTNL